ncbi:hypothetical protein MPSEU_000699100 [Mayamaea pseudoterrestris]|nr:hypothetical protein MPSEU_000699100 [Mayamaea pseudoterrestris]
MNASTPSNRKRPAFEKLLIGPAMVLGESLAGGHYLDVLCLGKQMATGRVAPSYYKIHRTLVHESKGFLPAFYRGFYPWGLVQCTKGLPVLFVQHESMHLLQQRAGMEQSAAGNLSGCLGGIAQAIFVTPFQKIKVSVVASSNVNMLTPTEAFMAVIQRDGIAGLYSGLLPTMLRGSIDWGLRFGISLHMKECMLEEKRNSSEEVKLSLLESISCGLVGGATSALTQPIDNIVTNCQKPLPPGTSRAVHAVMLRMYRESGMKAFTRSMGLTVVDSAWHMAWMFGVGNVLYDWMDKSLQEPEHRPHHQKSKLHPCTSYTGDQVYDYCYNID